MKEKSRPSQEFENTQADFENAYISDVRKIQLINYSDLKRNILLKRRLHWDGQNKIEKFMNRKKIQTNSQGSDNNLQVINCPICMDVFVRSILTICGHSFCERCFIEGMLRKTQCPICRASIKKQQFLYPLVIENQIRNLVEKCENETTKNQFKQRTNEHDQWVKDRKILNFDIGQNVDVLDSENIWCVGSISGLLKMKNDIQVLIHFEEWNKHVDEYISINSHRLAPKGFFTGRADIPRYQNNDALYSYTILSHDLENTTNDSRVRLNQVFDLLNMIFQRGQNQQSEPNQQPLIEVIQNLEPQTQQEQDQIVQPIFDGPSIFLFSEDEPDVQPDQSS